MCDTMVLVEPGRVLFAKNSDRDPNEAQLLEWHPAREHASGTTVACTWIGIPQVERTHAVLISRPYWMWGAEMGANEHGVVIGNEAVFTRQPYAKSGLTGMDLLRLALERATTAREAVDVITALLADPGQGGGCGHENRGFTYHNSFLIADHRLAVVLETAGRHWAVEEVTVGSRSISNGLTIPSFAREHADRLRGRVAQCDLRRSTTEHRARSATTARDLMGVLRTHADGAPGPHYSLVNGGMGAPCMHAGGLVASSQTTASWVSELTTDGARHWATGTAAPCTSVFLPVAVDAPTDLGPAPTDVADDRTWWWRHERLHRAVMRDPASLLPRFAPERDEIEASWASSPPTTDDAAALVDDHRAAWTADVESLGAADHRPLWVRRYWHIRDQRARAVALT